NRYRRGLTRRDAPLQCRTSWPGCHGERRRSACDAVARVGGEGCSIRLSYLSIHRRSGMQAGTLGVVGSGLMGSGIAQVAAYHGFDVTLVDIDQERVDNAIASIKQRLAREAQRERITQEDAD